MKTPKVLTAVVLVLVVLGATVTAYGTHFLDRALPRTAVAGLDVAGQTREQVATTLAEQFDAVTVALRTPTGTTRQESLASLGYSLDLDATLDAVFTANESWQSYATALVSERDVDPVLASDPGRLADVADGLAVAIGGRGVDATVRRSGDKRSFVVTPSVTGQQVVLADLRQGVARAGRGLASATVPVELVDVEPPVTTADAQAVADRANAMVARSIVLSDGDTELTASAKRKASWLRIPDEDGAPGAPTVRVAKVRAWVESFAEDAYLGPTNGLRNVSETGRVLTEIAQPRDGRTVVNTAEVTDAVVEALTDTSDYRGELAYRSIQAGWTDRVIASGAQDLAYQAAPGEKWIDVNLSRHTMTAYEGATVVRGPVAMVNGAAETPTVVGTFRIYHKNPMMTMRGFNTDGTRYEVPDVPWSSFFHNGYALHGAPWRSSFGYSDSHGCVNLPVDVAQWVYAWAAVGTPVVSHH